ncbi:MAG: VWA domain-containing protein [Deltaproteobacteria bacterium]|nr:VWA domain-containing protein [Deltaproteobacteria bacterium]
MTSRLMAIGTVVALAAVIAVVLAMPGLRFGDTAFLAGVAAAILPLLIHLIGRQRATPHPFAAMSLLLRAERRVARRLEIGNLALLTLRTLATALIPIILARPHAASADVDRPPPAPDASTVIVIDASFSMQTRLRGTPLFEIARDRVADLVREMGAAEELAIIVARKVPERVTPGLTADRALLRATAGKLAVSSERADIAAALSDAETLLQGSTRATRRVVLISDFAGPNFPEWRPADPAVVLYNTDVAKGVRLQNRAITSVRTQPAFDVGANTFRFSVAIANHSDEPARDLAVRLHVGTQELSGTLNIPPHAEATKDFHLAVPLGEILTGRATIAPDDLPIDDSFAFVVSSNLGPRILIVNGAPSTIAHRDEVHYLTRALRVVSTPQGPMRTTVVTADEPVDPGSFDIVFLCNVGAGAQILGEPQIRDLESAIRRGTGLVVTVGSNTSAKTFAGNIGRLLPAALHTANVRSPTTPLTTLAPPSDRGSTRAFKEAAAVGSAPPSFTRTIVLLPKAAPGVETLLRFSDGTPALVEQTLDAGRILLFASSIDRDWTDLPVRPVFAPWLADVVEALTAKVGVERTARVTPGNPLPIPRDRHVVVTGPSGVVETRSPSDSRTVIARLAGLHRIEIRALAESRTAKSTSTPLAVTLDPAESNLTKAAVSPSDPRGTPSVASTDARPLGPPLMTAFAIALLIFLFVEAAVVSRR